jgi:hypothetical protein
VSDLITDAEFECTEFYRDWCRHLDLFCLVGVVTPRDARPSAFWGSIDRERPGRPLFD